MENNHWQARLKYSMDRNMVLMCLLRENAGVLSLLFEHLQG